MLTMDLTIILGSVIMTARFLGNQMSYQAACPLEMAHNLPLWRLSEVFRVWAPGHHELFAI
jgi:hypothetical protein